MKVKILDRKKWLVKVLISADIWVGISLFILILQKLQGGDVNKQQDMFILSCVPLMAVVVGYWIYAYKTTTIMLPLDEYLAENHNIDPNYLRNLLLKQGYSIGEVSKIVRNNKIIYNNFDGNEEIVDNNVLKKNFNSKMGTKTKAFILSIIIGTFLGIAGRSFAGGLACTFMSWLIIMPIALIIGSTRELNNKIETNLPIVFNKLKEQGINTEERYISYNGNGIVIDRESRNIMVITAQKDEPFIVPFNNVSGCELMETITERLGNSDMGYVGMLTGNERLKELGHYDDRKIEQFYTQLGITIIVEAIGRTVRLDIPFINGEINTWAAGNVKELALEAVSNVNSALAYSTGNGNIDEIKEKAKDLLKQSNYILKTREISAKMKEIKEKLTKEEIDLFVGEEDDIFDPMPYEERQEWIKDNDSDLKNFKSIIPHESDDYDKMIKLIDRQNRLLEKEDFRRSDWANYYNYMVEFKKIVEKYEKKR